MKKYICLLAGAALLAACEQKTETVAPAASPAPTPEAAANAAESPASAESTMTTPPAATESPTINTNQTGSWVSPTPTP